MSITVFWYDLAGIDVLHRLENTTSSTIRILSSAEKCRRVARRISFPPVRQASCRLRIWVSWSFLRHYDETQSSLNHDSQSEP
jgi:hypothetical protein